jgi:hypothetical protein
MNKKSRPGLAIEKSCETNFIYAPINLPSTPFKLCRYHYSSARGMQADRMLLFRKEVRSDPQTTPKQDRPWNMMEKAGTTTWKDLAEDGKGTALMLLCSSTPLGPVHKIPPRHMKRIKPWWNASNASNAWKRIKRTPPQWSEKRPCNCHTTISDHGLLATE